MNYVYLLSSCLKFGCWCCMEALGQKQGENRVLQSPSDNLINLSVLDPWLPVCQPASEEDGTLCSLPSHSIPRALPVLCTGRVLWKICNVIM